MTFHVIAAQDFMVADVRRLLTIASPVLVLTKAPVQTSEMGFTVIAQMVYMYV